MVPVLKITVQPRREEAIKAGFAALLDRLPHAYSFELFREDLAEWDVRAFCAGDRAVGMLMQRGAELHVAVLPEVRGKWLSRRLIREVFAPVLEAHGEAVTSVAPENEKGRDFVNRIREGFANHTFDPTTALLSAGGSLLSSAIQAGSADRAGGQAAAGANRASDTQMQMFDTVNKQGAPWRQAGENALRLINFGFGTGAAPSMGAAPAGADPALWGDPNYQKAWRAFNDAHTAQYGVPVPANADPAVVSDRLRNWFGYVPSAGGGGGGGAGEVDPATGLSSGYFTRQFGANDLNAQLAPNWKFALDQGIGATRNAANLQTGLLSGNTLKGIADYTLNKSGDLYQQAFNNYQAQQSNIFNRLSNIAGLGQQSNASTGQAGASLAGNAGQAQTAAGAAQAAGTMGVGNALGGGVDNALGWYSVRDLINGGGIGGGSGQGLPGIDT